MKLKKIYVINISFFIALIVLFSVFVQGNFDLKNVKYITSDFLMILTNNILVINKAIVFSFFSLGIYSIWFLIMNAYSISTFFQIIFKFPELLILIVPHGIIEIPIFILAASIPIKLIADIFNNQMEKPVFYIRLIILVELSILLAAIIEAFLTPYLGNLVLFKG